MATDFIQLPPDSTGKRIRHVSRLDIVVTNSSQDIFLTEKGEPVTGQTSGTTAKYIGTETELGVEYVYVDDANGDFQVGEILDIGTNGTSAEVVSQEKVYSPVTHITDPEHLNQIQRISEEGAAIVRFVEGNLGFDTFGHGQFAQPETIDIHSFIYDDRGAEKYGDTTVNGGSIDVLPDSSELVLSTTGVSGSKAVRQTHQYYPYTPGVGTEVLLSTKTGDTGKSGLVRRWGLFDDNDGLYFEQSGSVFSVNIRSKASGVITEDKVLQSNFNQATLSNNVGTSFPLDISKYNLFWIDFAWLGVNKIRFGVYTPAGDRLVAHTFENTNNIILPYSRRGTLPLRIEQDNEGTVGSSSEFSLICAAIKRQSAVDEYRGKEFEVDSNPISITSSEYTPVISVKPRVTFGGKDNRVTYFLNGIDWAVKGTGSVDIQSYTNPILSGSTFNEATQSYQSLLVDTDASGSQGGTRRGGFLIEGTGFREIKEDLETSLINLVDGTAPIVSFQAKTPFAGETEDIKLKLRWKEVH